MSVPTCSPLREHRSLEMVPGLSGWPSRASLGMKRGERMVGADAQGWRAKPGRHGAAEGLIFQEHLGRTW